MNAFLITVYIEGRKKAMRSTRFFPASFTEDTVRETMKNMLLYYYFAKDIRHIDVSLTVTTRTKDQKPTEKKTSHVC